MEDGMDGMGEGLELGLRLGVVGEVLKGGRKGGDVEEEVGRGMYGMGEVFCLHRSN